VVDSLGLKKTYSDVIPYYTTTEHTTGTGVFLGGRHSIDEVVAFGGVSPPLVGARSSQRIMSQINADATQMERAQNLAKAKRLPYSKVKLIIPCFRSVQFLMMFFYIERIRWGWCWVPLLHKL
jgi:hypothetical protein